MKDQPKVLYDISVLGLGHSNPICRAGVYRVVETLAHYLVQSPDCELKFSAGASFELLRQSIAYLQSQSNDLGKIALPYHAIQKWASEVWDQPVSQSLVAINQRIDQANNGQQWLLKLLRKPLFLAYRSMMALNPLDPASLRWADLYHSTFYPFPDRVRDYPNLQCVLTLYDLIPILYPHFFQANDDVVLKAVLASLKPQDWVLCISQSTKNDLCEYRPDLDPNRVFVTPLGASELFYPCLDPAQIQTVKTKYQIPDRPYFLSLSTLEPRKNISQIIRAFVQLIEQENIKDLSLVLVGQQGWKYADILELAAASHLQDRVILTGYVENADLAALYSGAIGFVYPSFYEGFGLPPLEAMQCGVPVITSNTSSLPEVVGTAGITLSPNDLDGWCQALLRLYQDTDLRRELSQQSLQQAQKFSWNRCFEQTMVAYTTALHRKGIV
ncbi:MAG: glycosyltransferase family 1 protein [Leptolyngbyaceae cyanobacterium bins.59]|nr:glycosyltransferase family 1 protein [Leptolyngbyaceae cyanobacterium bins.59]